MSAKDWDPIYNSGMGGLPNDVEEVMRHQAHRKEVEQEIFSRRDAEIRAGAKARTAAYEAEYNRRVTERLRKAGQIPDED